MKEEFKTTIYADTIEGKLGLGVDYYKGEPGKSGADEVYIGAEPPTDPQVKLWVDTEAQSVGAVDWNNVENKPNFATVATSGSYNDLTDKPVIPEAPDLTNYATKDDLANAKPDLTPYAKTADLSTVATSGSYEDLTNKPNLFSGDYQDLTNKPNLFSGNYEDLTNKPTIPEPYTLPTASTTTLGGVKVDGETITIADGVISSAGGGGSVSVDGTSIVQNKDGTISTALKTTKNSIIDANLINLRTYDPILHQYPNSGKNSIQHSIINISQSYPFEATSIGDSILFGYRIGSELKNNSTYSNMMNSMLIGDTVECNCFGDYTNIAFGMGYALKTRGNQFVIGRNNIADVSGNAYNYTYSFIIGNGPNYLNDTKRSNGLTVDLTGNLAIAGTMSSAGADYAEFFEWKDGNPEAEDRVGYIVSLDGDKLTLANEGDYILGVVSGTATVLGDNPEWSWAKRWVTDDFGRIQYEDKVIHHEAENGRPAWDEPVREPITNPDYNPDQEYTKRADRPEWSAVGMMGKLYVRDDGTCQVNGYAKPINGVATASTSGTIRGIERVSDNVIRVVSK